MAMEPIFGRFHSLLDASGNMVFARLTSASVLEVLASDVAFRVSLFDPKRSPKIQGRKEPPSLELLALLLAIPSTTAAISQKRNALTSTSTHPRNDVTFELKCRDRSGVELVVTTVLEPTPARQILAEMHESLFSAIVALEAIVRDAGGEKHSTFLDEKDTQTPSLSTIQTSMLPLSIRGQPVETQAVFRRAAAADIRIQGNRAFVLANAAARVRAELLEQRRARKEAEMRKKKRERELLQAAKRKHEMMKAAKGKPIPVVKRRKKSLFEIADEHSKSTEAMPKTTQARRETAEPDETVMPERKRSPDAEPSPTQSRTGPESKRASEAKENREVAVKEEDVIVNDTDKTEPAMRPPLPKKRKKKRVRTLV